MDEDNFYDGLASASRLFQKTRTALSRESVSKDEVLHLSSQVSDLHQTLTERLTELSDRLGKTRKFLDIDKNIEAKARKLSHGVCSRDYGLTLGTQITLNCMRAALSGKWYESTKRENEWLCKEICDLGERDAVFHMPLGSSWMLIALPVAYAGAYTEDSTMRVLTLIKTYKKDLSLDTLQDKIGGLEALAN